MVEMTDSLKNITDFIKTNRKSISPMIHFDTDSSFDTGFIYGFYISKELEDYSNAILEITRTTTDPVKYSLNKKEIMADVGSYIFDTFFKHWAGTVTSNTEIILDEVSESINKYKEGIDNG